MHDMRAQVTARKRSRIARSPMHDMRARLTDRVPYADRPSLVHALEAEAQAPFIPQRTHALAACG